MNMWQLTCNPPVLSLVRIELNTIRGHLAGFVNLLKNKENKNMNIENLMINPLV